MSLSEGQKTLQEFMMTYVHDASAAYVSDIKHSSKELLGEQRGSVKTPPMQFMAECTEENLEIAHILRHEAFTAPCFEGYGKPQSVDDVESLTAALEASAADLMAALEAIGDDGLAEVVTCPDGEELPAFRLATRVANHMKYHDLYTGVQKPK